MELTLEWTWDGEPLRADERTFVSLRRHGGLWHLEVDAPYFRDLPPAAPPGSTEGLWNHEVVEIFLVEEGSLDDSPRYTEIELGPHGHFLILTFRGVRRRAAVVQPVTYRRGVEGTRWWGVLTVQESAMPASPYRVNAFAIHGPTGGRKHFAYRPVPGTAPDFHQPGAFPAWRD